jgi:hypothetical protein
LSSGWQAEQENLGLGSYASNPYSQAALLSRQRDIGNRTVLNTAGRHLYGGSTVSAHRGVASSYDRGRSALDAKASQDQTTYEQRMREADQSYQSGLGQLQESALERALQSTPQPAPAQQQQQPQQQQPARPKKPKGRGR